MNASELRESFLKYFEKNGHKRVASSSLVPANDPTLFFTNAGMVQFKDVFLGDEKRPYVRAATSQKCMRVSGKHNDLENVGRTPRHHTFFEMLGNFSFGDYFKKEAIAYGWEYLTKAVGLPKDRLYVTVYSEDGEALDLWKKHVDGKRVFRFGEKDNFWAMADVGPCGPCSEVHFDMNPAGAVKKCDLETGRFMEVWNLVFMQFNRDSNGKLTKLAKPSIDTGMGLERLAAVVEGVPGNYETDLFRPIISELEKVTKKKYGSRYDMDSKDAGWRDDVSMRVISDHVRAMVFLIGDGVQPSNEGRGYVLRRIIRRAARHGKMLKIDRPFFVPLAHVVIDTMGAVYPGLIEHDGFIEKVVQNEEERFNETLDKGLEILRDAFASLKKKGKKSLPGEDVFRLYDTYGFPVDLTADIAGEAGFAIDHRGFEQLMNEQRERARSAWKGSGEKAVLGVYKELQKRGIKSVFTGYSCSSGSARVLAIVKDGKEISGVKEGEKVGFAVDKTPFYGESGGQAGDTGIAVGDGLEIEITDTSKPLADLIIHHGKVVKGSFKKGDSITLAADAERRADMMKNHTATHILHKALRSVLGEHVKQSGSLVTGERLRFDFSHFQAMTPDEISEVETTANRVIREDLPVCVEELQYKKAVEKGALAFFGDKYGDVVRTVSVGDYSCELCGGTHVSRTGEIGMVKILSESSVAAGVRRIEAVTGRGVENLVRSMEAERLKISTLLKASPGEIAARLEKLFEENKKLKKELESARSKLVSGGAGNLDGETENVGNIKVLARFVEGADPKELRGFSDQLKARLGSGILLLVAESGGKTSLVVSVTKDLEKKVSAGNLMRELALSIGGTGGGRSDMAQGGASITGKFDILKKNLLEIVKKQQII